MLHIYTYQQVVLSACCVESPDCLSVNRTEVLMHLCCSNLALFGESLGSAEAFSGEDLAECMIYRRRSWKGVLPVSHLAQWALERQVSRRQDSDCLSF